MTTAFREKYFGTGQISSPKDNVEFRDTLYICKPNDIIFNNLTEHKHFCFDLTKIKKFVKKH